MSTLAKTAPRRQPPARDNRTTQSRCKVPGDTVLIVGTGPANKDKISSATFVRIHPINCDTSMVYCRLIDGGMLLFRLKDGHQPTEHGAPSYSCKLADDDLRRVQAYYVTKRAGEAS